ncbi:hypothetical protein GCM10011410_27370 [Hoyosella rhizosphaerae]|uniref:Uncharacterized protein n=1 Tax=Hoyosella rhizosphaerae TaxID=1755582 RepID=A0A916XH27_9ACTN|nr:hypothetical protein GCM10011410_27370 [Hoyosella rhizosphaerae]
MHGHFNGEVPGFILGGVAMFHRYVGERTITIGSGIIAFLLTTVCACFAATHAPECDRVTAWK